MFPYCALEAVRQVLSGIGDPESLETLNEKAVRLEAAMKAGPTLDLEVVHHFGGGIYARELRIPKAVTVVGEIHRTENMNILVKGEISVTTQDGVKRLKAPAIVVADAGGKRVGYAHEDTVWVTLHATRETDVEKIKAQFIAPSFAALADASIVPNLEGE